MSDIHNPVFYTIVKNRYYLPCKKEINFFPCAASLILALSLGACLKVDVAVLL